MVQVIRGLVIAVGETYPLTILHKNQIPTSATLVQRLIRSQYPSLAGESIATEPMGGTDNAIYRVGEHHAVRLPIIDWAEGRQDAIRLWMPLLAQQLTLEVPVPIYYGAPEDEYPFHWTIQPWIDGNTYQYGHENPQLSTELSLFLTELWSLPINDSPAAPPMRSSQDENVRRNLHLLQESEHRHELIHVWDTMRERCQESLIDAVWTHCDLGPGNLLQRNGRLISVIDWTNPGIGDPARDLMVAWNLFGPTSREVFQRQINIDRDTWKRAEMEAFAQAALALPYYRETYPLLANQARNTFKQILSDRGLA